LNGHLTKKDMQMPNKYLKRSYVMKETQIKTTVRYYYRPIEWPQSRTLTTLDTGEDMEQQEFSFINSHKYKMVQPLLAVS
jgi:hypothetical protein